MRWIVSRITALQEELLPESVGRPPSMMRTSRCGPGFLHSFPLFRAWEEQTPWKEQRRFTTSFLPSMRESRWRSGRRSWRSWERRRLPWSTVRSMMRSFTFWRSCMTFSGMRRFRLRISWSWWKPALKRSAWGRFRSRWTGFLPAIWCGPDCRR